MQKVSWTVFILMMVFAIFFVIHTAPGLPALVPSHFDAAGFPNAFMTHNGYIRFTLMMGVGFPLALVAFLTLVYRHASNMKLPNRDYWLAPGRIAQTRALLVAHGIWFGSLLVAIVCFVHWLELGAQQRTPPQLSNAAVEAGMLAFILVAAGWIVALLIAFRRPGGG
jgi:uncharacterized membrane protein